MSISPDCERHWVKTPIISISLRSPDGVIDLWRQWRRSINRTRRFHPQPVAKHPESRLGEPGRSCGSRYQMDHIREPGARIVIDGEHS